MNPHTWRLPPADWWLVAPELLLLGAAALLPLTRSPRLARAASLLVVGLGIPLLWGPLGALLDTAAEGPLPFFARRDALLTGWWGAVTVDGLSVLARAGLLATAWLRLFGERRPLRPAERSLQLGATAGACLVAQASDLGLLWIALELSAVTARLSQAADLPAADHRRRLLHGAACGALALWGISILYGLTGTTAIYGYPDRPDTLAFERRDALSEVLAAALARAGGLEVTLIGLACTAGGLLLRGGFLSALRAPGSEERPAWPCDLVLVASWAAAARLLYACFPGDWWEMPVAALGAAAFLGAGLQALRSDTALHVCALARGGAAWAALAALGPLPTPIPPAPEPLELGLGSGPLCLLVFSMLAAAGLGAAPAGLAADGKRAKGLAVRYLQASAVLFPPGSGSLAMALTVAPMLAGASPWRALGGALCAGWALFVAGWFLAERRERGSAGAAAGPGGLAAAPAAALLLTVSAAAIPAIQFLSQFR